MNLKESFIRYFDKAAGHTPAMEAVEASHTAKLPLYLRSYYHFFRAVIFERPLLLAVQEEGKAMATPAEYAAHYNKLRAVLGEDVALLLPVMASYTRSQLMQQRVPFIVPDRQMFLPTLLVDLRERFSRAGRLPAQHLSAAAQVVLLRHLLGKPVEGLALGELAAKLGYSAMTLSNVRQELEATDLCQTIREQHRLHLVFPMSRRKLWARADSLCQDPVKNRYWIQFAKPGDDWLRAGLTALAELTLVTDDALPTFAVKEEELRQQRKRRQIIFCSGPEEAQAQLEAWRYDPRLLADGQTVDCLSLALTLREAHDERVAQAIGKLVERMPW